MILKGSGWFTVNYSSASQVIADVVSNYKKYLELSRKQPQHVKDNFNLDGMGKILCDMVDKGINAQPKQVTLKLPKLPTLNKV